jgi:type I restriction enzyme R subunit
MGTSRQLRTGKRLRSAALAAEKEAAMTSTRESGLSARAFGVYWSLRDDAAIKAAGIELLAVAREADRLLGRFPNATVNPEERRRIRADLYKPLLKLGAEERSRVVELAMAYLIPEDQE